MFIVFWVMHTGLEHRPTVVETFDQFQKDYLLDKSKDTTYVINFWATWCRPCVKELPYFEKLNKEYDSLQITLVSLDFEESIETGVIPLVKRLGIESEVVVLTDGNTSEWIDRVDSTWSGAIPATVIIKNGETYFLEKSFETYEELHEQISNY